MVILAASFTMFFVMTKPAMAINVVSGPCTTITNNKQSSSVCTDNSSGQNPNNTANDNPIFGPNGVITLIVQILSVVIGVAAVIVIIIAGLRFIIANGDSASINTARNAIIYAVIGLVIAVFAQLIIAFVLNRV